MLFGTFSGYLVYFSPFCYVVARKIWQLCFALKHLRFGKREEIGKLASLLSFNFYMACLFCPFQDFSGNFADFFAPRVRFLKVFSQKIGVKMAFLTQNKAKLCKILIITLFFRKTPIVLPKIVENR
jgi:hypothetical protein